MISSPMMFQPQFQPLKQEKVLRLKKVAVGQCRLCQDWPVVWLAIKQLQLFLHNQERGLGVVLCLGVQQCDCASSSWAPCSVEGGIMKMQSSKVTKPHSWHRLLRGWKDRQHFPTLAWEQPNPPRGELVIGMNYWCFSCLCSTLT